MSSRFLRPICRRLVTVFILAWLSTASLWAGNVGKAWRITSPQPTSSSLPGLVWTGTQLVAMGRDVALTSPDGITWSAAGLGGDFGTCLAWSGSLFVAGSSDVGHVLTSTDGRSWAKNAIGYSGIIDSIIWTGSQFCALGGAPGPDNTVINHLLTSSDGLVWTHSVIPVPAGQSLLSVEAVAKAGSVYMIAGYAEDDNFVLTAYIATSPDGITWTPATLDANAPDAFNALAWNGTQAVAVGDNGKIYTTATALGPWTAQDSNNVSTELDNVIWDGAQFVATGSDASLTSPDGVTWTATTQTKLADRALVYTGGLYVASGSHGLVETSPDAVTWTRQIPTGTSDIRWAVAHASAQGGTGWISVGGDTDGVIETSLDGKNWLRDTLPAGIHSLNGISVQGGTEIVVGEGGSILFSTDGTAWTDASLTTNEELIGVASSASLSVAVGDAGSSTGIIYTSTVASAWTSATLPSGTPRLVAITYTGSQWIAVGDGGTILTSPDGTTWTARTSNTSNPLFAITTSGTTIVAAGGGVILTSPDGINWTETTPSSLFRTECDGIVWDGSDFIVLAGPDVVTSPDGRTWSSYTTGSANDLLGIATTGTGANVQVLAVGDGGVVALSDPTPTVTTSLANLTALDTAGTVQLTVNLSFDNGGTSVPFTLGGTAVAGTDYTVQVSPLTFATGETSKTLTFTLLPQAAASPDKTVIFTLGTPSNARLGLLSTTVLTILNTQNPPMVNFASSSLTATEGDGTVAVALQLSWPPVSAVTVPLLTSGTATSGQDYTALPASITFAPGQQYQSLSIPLIDDTDVENDETLVVSLGTPTNGLLGGSTDFTLIIQDNDVAGGVGGHWLPRNPLPGNGLDCVTWSPDLHLLLIMGEQGLALTSPDGHTWIQRITGTTRPHSSAAWGGLAGGRRFVAVGGDNTMLTSTDGIAWVESNFPGTASTLDASMTRVAWVNNRFIALGTSIDFNAGTDVPVAFTSPDGVTWTRQSLGTVPGGVNAATWTGSQYVIVGFGATYNAANKLVFNPVVLTSPDAVTWTDHSATGPAGVSFDDVAWTGSLLVATCNDKTVYTSPDAVHWTKRTVGSLGTVDREVWSGTKLVAVGQATATSTNATTWTEKASGIAPLTLVDVTYTGSLFVAVGGTSTILTSTDGAAWTRFAGGVDTNNASIKSIAWSGTQFVAVGDAGLILNSPTGTAWTKRASPVTKDLYHVTWSGTQFVAVGHLGTLLTSANGITWTPHASGTTLDLFNVLWTGSQFVAVGGQDNYNDPVKGYTLGTSVVLTSPNGIAWTKRPVPVHRPLNGIAFNGTQYVICGGGGTILTSPDSLVWTSQIPNTIYNINDVTWTGSLFVAVGDSGVILHSTDAVNWMVASVPYPYAGYIFSGVSWTGSTCIVVGGGGGVLTSTDADVWTAHPSGTLSNLHGLAWNGAMMLAVGDTGTIISSGSSITPPVPVLSFTTASASVTEGDVPLIVGVQLSSPPVQKVTVPFTTNGSLRIGAKGDLVLPTSPLVFNPGVSVLYLPVKIVNDNMPPPPATTRAGSIILSTPASGATLGTPASFYLTLQDNDIAVSITTQPLPMWLFVDDIASPALIVAATGNSTPAYQWQKGGVNIAGATFPQYEIYHARLSDGGLYKAVVKNNVGPVASSAVELAVVDNTAYPVVVATNGTATFAAHAQGSTATSLQYQWYRGASVKVNNSGTRITGATTKTLVVKQATAADADNYYCVITSTAQSGSENTGDYTLSVTAAKPQFVLPTAPGGVPDPLPNGSIAVPYTPLTIAMLADPAVKFSATGLPAGMKIDPVFGVLYGTPTALASNQKVTITATNASGSASAVSHITVTGLPAGVAGSFDGFLGRDSLVNGNQGWRVQATITAVGGFTAKVFAGAASYSLAGPLLFDGTNYGAAATLATGSVTTGFGFTCNPTDGTLTLEAFHSHYRPMQGLAWRNGWNSVNKAVNYQGYFTFSIDASAAFNGDLTAPHGTGFGSCTVPPDGKVFVVSGRLADNSVFTTSTFLGPNGQVLIFQPLYNSSKTLAYAGHGGLLGYVIITPGAVGALPTVGAVDSGSNPTLSWFMPATITPGARIYPQGFEMDDLAVAGTAYLKPGTSALVMDLASTTPNATLTFAEQDFTDNSDAPNINVQVLLTGKIAVLTSGQNPHSVTLAFTPATGAFAGSFKLSEPNPLGGTLQVTRLVPFSGMIVTHGAVKSGAGFFMLPTLPVSPTYFGADLTAAQTPIRSGGIVVMKY